MNIEKKLKQWLDNGLIQEDQFNNLLEYEKNQKKPNYWVYSILSLGIVVLVIGIISIIASNWDDIPDVVKLFTNFLVLFINAFFIFKFNSKEKELFFETTVVLFSLLLFASIGLISQIYHTGGELYEATLFWSFISLPLFMHTKSRFPSHIWFVIFLPSIAYKITATRTELKNIDFVLIFQIFLPLFLSTMSTFFINHKTESIKRFSLTSIFYSMLILISNTFILNSFLGRRLETSDYFLPFMLISNGLLVVNLFLNYKNFYSKIFILLIIWALLMNLNLILFSQGKMNKILDVLFFISQWFTLGFLFLKLEKYRLFELSLVIIGIRFLIVYIDLFESLLYTGFGLILSGLLIISICLMYLKYRLKILQLFKGEL
jgi:uncharacterized membrane protein